MPNLPWTVEAIPLVIVGGLILVYFLRKQKGPKSTDHVLKL